MDPIIISGLKNNPTENINSMFQLGETPSKIQDVGSVRKLSFVKSFITKIGARLEGPQLSERDRNMRRNLLGLNMVKEQVQQIDAEGNIRDEDSVGAEAGIRHFLNRLNSHDVTRRGFLEYTGVLVATPLVGKVNKINPFKVEQESREQINTGAGEVFANGLNETQKRLQKVGINMFQREDGTTAFGINDELNEILRDTTESGEDINISEQIDNLLGWVETNLGKEPREVVIDVVGSIIAIKGIMNTLNPDIGHITKGDYARVMAWTGFSYLIGSEDRKIELEHNSKETVTATATILALTEASDLVIAGRKKEVEKFIELAGLDGVTAENFGDYLDELRINDPDGYVDIISTAEDLYPDHEAFRELILGSTGGELDLANFIEGLDFDLSNKGNVEKLRILILGINTLNPVLTSIVGPSILTSIVREIATDEHGEPDLEAISAMQGFLPNSLAMYAPPILYGNLSKVFKNVPFVKDLVLGADFGPRLALSQVGGEHGVESLMMLDGYNGVSQILSNMNFVGEMASIIARKEGRSKTSVIKELLDPRAVRGTVNALREYTVKSNIQDATFGRAKRATEVIREGLHPHLLHQGLEDEDEIAHIKQASKYSPREAWRKFNAATDFHHWGGAIGHEMVDISTTLPFQSLCVPYIQGLFGSIINAVEKTSILHDKPKAKEQGIDLIQNMIFGAMSSTFDNFAACKASLGISVKRMEHAIKEGIYVTEEEINKRFMAMVAKNYASAVDGGGLLPLGNMPNLKLFSLHFYSLADAMNPKFLFRRSIPMFVHYAQHQITESLGLFSSKFKFDWFNKKSAH